MIDIKDPVEVVDFVGQQGRISLRSSQSGFPVVQPYVFHLNKSGPVNDLAVVVGQRQAVFISCKAPARCNDFRIDKDFDFPVNTADDQSPGDSLLGRRQPPAHKGFGKKADQGIILQRGDHLLAQRDDGVVNDIHRC